MEAKGFNAISLIANIEPSRRANVPPKEAVISWLRTYIAVCTGVVAVVFLGLVLLVSFVDLGLSGHGIAALFLGALLTVGLGMVLMGLVFSSSRDGLDESVHGTGRGAEPKLPNR